MSETIGILTWNVCGDKNENRMKELEEIFADIGNAGQTVDLICLQETSEDGVLLDYLRENNFFCFQVTEGKNGGRCYIVGLNLEALNSDPEGLSLERLWVNYEGPCSGPLRYPVFIDFEMKGMNLRLYTVHSPFGNSLWECIEAYGQDAEAAAASDAFAGVFATGDFNLKMAEDPEQAGIEQYFDGFIGFSNQWDHIFGGGPGITGVGTGINYPSSCSDHDAVYVQFAMGE